MSEGGVRDESVGNGVIGADILGFPNHVCATVGTENVLVGGVLCVCGRSGGVFRRDVVDVWWVDGWLAVNLEMDGSVGADCGVVGLDVHVPAATVGQNILVCGDLSMHGRSAGSRRDVVRWDIEMVSR